MVKFLKCFSILGLLCLLYGCDRTSQNITEPPVEDSTGASEAASSVYTEETETAPSVHSEEAETEADNGLPSDVQYSTEIPGVPAGDLIALTEIQPPEFEDKKLGYIMAMISENEILCNMREKEDDEDVIDVGIWSLDTGAYHPLFSVEEGDSWDFLTYDDEYFFFMQKGISYEFNPFGSWMWQYDRKDNTMEMIFEHTRDSDGYSGVYYANQRILQDGWLYFEDLIQKPTSGWLGSAWRYHEDTGEKEHLGWNLMNPMEVDGEVWYIEINSASDQHRLKNVHTGEELELPPHLSDIKSNGNEVMVLCQVARNRDDDLSVYALRNVTEDREIFRVVQYLAELSLNRYFAAWSTLHEDCPMLYVHSLDRVLKLDQMEEGTHYYYFYENCGLIHSVIYGDGGKMKYTYFEYTQDPSICEEGAVSADDLETELEVRG